ncbi:hypothetical protein ScPMuIL_001882 [Solemya velum]
MPVILLERIPLPSLQTYTTFSVLLLSCAILYAHQIVTTSSVEVPDEGEDSDATHEFLIDFNGTLPYDDYKWNMLHVLTIEVLCVWTLVNTAYCCLILLGKVIQKFVFGELRVSEQQHLKDKFWNFIFYKFIFIFGVMNVQTMEDVLSKDRFEYLSFSPTIPRLVHLKLLSLLFVILLSSIGLLVVCGMVGVTQGVTIFSFMAAECILLGIRALYVVLRYAIHLWDMNMEGVWENRSVYVYYTELVFELAALSVDFAHHLHMLLWGNIFLSMASLVICMQLRYLFYEFQRRFRRHKNYLKVIKNMEASYSMATVEDLEKNSDDCAVCWEKMECARKLPCGHLFHNSCLISWLEQDTSCPTCRMSLNDREEADPNGNTPDGRGDAEADIPIVPENQSLTNHFFHFDGSRYTRRSPVELQTSQLDNMARQVQSVFPHIAMNVVLEDLRLTRSVDFTIENILEGRLQIASNGTYSARGTTPEEEETEHTSPSQIVLPTNVSQTGVMGLQAALNQVASEMESGTSSSSRFPRIRRMWPWWMKSAQKKSWLHLAVGFQNLHLRGKHASSQRKFAMLEQARRRFLAKNNSTDGEESERKSRSACVCPARIQ